MFYHLLQGSCATNLENLEVDLMHENPEVPLTGLVINLTNFITILKFFK